MPSAHCPSCHQHKNQHSLLTWHLIVEVGAAQTPFLNSCANTQEHGTLLSLQSKGGPGVSWAPLLETAHCTLAQSCSGLGRAGVGVLTGASRSSYWTRTFGNSSLG